MTEDISWELSCSQGAPRPMKIELQGNRLSISSPLVRLSHAGQPHERREPCPFRASFHRPSGKPLVTDCSSRRRRPRGRKTRSPPSVEDCLWCALTHRTCSKGRTAKPAWSTCSTDGGS